MRVIYELGVDDVKEIIAEKYGVSTEKISMPMVTVGNHFQINVDMSDTEMPGTEKSNSTNIDKSDDFENILDSVDAGKTIVKEEKKEAADDNPLHSDDPEVRYSGITDEKLEFMLNDGYSVTDICKLYDLEKKYAYRLYKRAEKSAKECASRRSGRGKYKKEA